MKFKFIATQIIKADNRDEAKEKFADSSWDLAAKAECHKVEPSPQEKLTEIITTITDKIKDDMQYGNIKTEARFYQSLNEYVNDQLLDLNLNLELATCGLLESDRLFRDKTRELVFKTVFIKSIKSVKESYPTLYKKIKEQR